MRTRFLLFTGAVAATGALALPAAASARTVTCAFQGLPGNMSPGVMLQGGGSTYDFATPTGSQTTQCEMNGSGLQVSAIRSVGQYDNIVCWTGTAWSGYNDRGPTPDTMEINVGGGPAEASMTYTIRFVAGQGVLDIHTVNGWPEGGTEPDGYVNARSGSCASAIGANSFELSGAFRAEW